jgi:hypothetical protein
MLLVHVCLVANDLNNPDPKQAKVMPPAQTLASALSKEDVCMSNIWFRLSAPAIPARQ